jgi:hypothetical protein
MICFAKPGLIEKLFILQKEEFVIARDICQLPSIFIRDNPIFSSERMLHMDNGRECSAKKKRRNKGL